MNRPLLFVLAGALSLSAGCGAGDDSKKKSEDEPSAIGSAVSAPMDYLAAQGQAKRLAVKTVTSAELTSAIQKFAAMEDRYPRDLNELVVQRYLAAPPSAPTGMMWYYNPQNGQVRLVAARGTTTPGVAPTQGGQQRTLPGLKNLPQQPRTLPE